MSELRWILLLVGVLFLIGLTAWESRRSRLARAAARERARALAETIPFGQPGPGAQAAGRPGAEAIPAWLEQPAGRSGPALGELPAAAVSDFPLEAGEAGAAGEQPIRAERRGGAIGAELPSMPLPARNAAVSTAGFELHTSAPSYEAEPGAQTGSAEVQAEADGEAQAHSEAEAEDDAEADADIEADRAAQIGAEAERDDRDATDESPDMDRAAVAQPLADSAAQGVTVEWPPEEQRRIVSVRIVATREQRLSGRATRQALAACGFVHGRYRIFHQPDAEGHALLSCASLNKPGVFDPSSMDYQRYTGLSLFTVLPGPLAPPEAVDRLLLTALDLSERLHARLQDDAGQTLDEARIAELRTRYRELDAMAGPPA